MNQWQERVATDPNVCHGKPCIRGTRVLVSVIVDNLAEGMSHDDVVREYPPLTLNDVAAALAYAAALAREESLSGCFTVADPGHTRIRRPAPTDPAD